MKTNDPQPSFNFDATVRAVAHEATRVTAAADARAQYDLPPDYGEATDWTPRASPFEIEWFESPKRAWNAGEDIG